jgi:hypothetical protein
MEGIMVDPNRGAGFGWSDPLDDEIHKLIEMVAELGIEAEGILFDGLSALLGLSTHGAQTARQAGSGCESRYHNAHQFGLLLLQNGSATPDQVRWIVELQHTNEAFRRIASETVRVATYSLELKAPVEEVLEQIHVDIRLLDFLAEGTRLQLRNSIIYTSSHKREDVHPILAEAAELQRAYNVLDFKLQTGIKAQPRLSFPMQQLLVIATQLLTIDTICFGIAKAVLYNPPPQH